ASKYLMCRRGLLIQPLPEGPRRDEAARRFRFVGRLLGQALREDLREGFIVPLPVGEEVFALLRGDAPGAESLPRPGGAAATPANSAACWPTSHRACGTRTARTAPGVPGARWRPLPRDGPRRRTAVPGEGGESLPVTRENVGSFVEQAAAFWFGEGVAAQVDALRAGLSEVLDLDSLRSFSPQELRGMFCGEDDHVEWDERALLARLHPAGGMTSRSPLFGHLVALLLEMDQANRSRFLDFVTSCPRLPPGGITNFKMYVFPDPGCRRGYPRSRACANQLYLPPYASKEELRERLHEAMHSSAGHHEQRIRDARPVTSVGPAVLRGDPLRRIYGGRAPEPGRWSARAPW
ncbi:unnamed protein product, partial [Prorocentrum cordatum]